MLVDPRRDRLPFVVILLSLTHAVLRYTVFKGTELDHLALFVTNKGASMAGILLVGLAPLRARADLRASTGMLAFGLLVYHAFASTILLKPEYLEKFFIEDGRLSGVAEISIAAGCLGLVGVLFLALATYSRRPPVAGHDSNPYRGWGRGILVLGLIHLFFMSYFEWLQVASWPGYLPPVSLVSFVGATGLLIARMRAK